MYTYAVCGFAIATDSTYTIPNTEHTSLKSPALQRVNTFYLTLYCLKLYTFF